MTSTREDPRAPARITIIVCALVFLTAVVGLARANEFLSAWFYVFCWWSYILAADAVVYLRTQRSLFWTHRRAFVLLSIWSAAFWLFFEVVNFKLKNWFYVGIPSDGYSLWLGTFTAFATVIPGVLVTRDLLASFGLFARARGPSFTLTGRARPIVMGVGIAFLVLPLLEPAIFYPLVWGAIVLFFEPWLLARGQRGILTSLARGDLRPLLLLLAAGFVTGGLWESWNYFAAAKWIYTVPFFDRLKVFEMPVAGFLGFPPFALECWTFARVLVMLGFVPEFEAEGDAVPARESGLRAREIVGVILALGFSIPAIAGVHRETLHATLARVREIPGIAPAAVAKLDEDGIDSVAHWLAADARGDAPELSSFAPAAVERWRERGRLMLVKGLGGRGIRWLGGARIDSVAALARSEPEDLYTRMMDVHAGPRPILRIEEVRVWIEAARRIASRDRPQD